MWIGAPSIPVVLLQASASLIASPQRLPLIARVCVSPERVLGRSSDSQVEMGGEMCEGDAIGPGDPGVRVAQRWVLVGSVRGPRELRAHRGGAAAGELFRQNRTQQWRRSHRGRSGASGGVRHASRTFSEQAKPQRHMLHMGAEAMLGADRVAKITGNGPRTAKHLPRIRRGGRCSDPSHLCRSLTRRV